MHDMVYVAALDVTFAKAGGGRDMWVGVRGATVDEVTFREAGIWGGKDMG
jgi:hypothetical protein